jgi:hypothetical protein
MALAAIERTEEPRTAGTLPQTEMPSWLSHYAKTPGNVFAFSQGRGILADVKTALDLAIKAFPASERIEIRTDLDPDEEYESVVIKVTIRADVASFLAAYQHCLEDWTAALSSEGLGLICLAYNVL